MSWIFSPSPHSPDSKHYEVESIENFTFSDDGQVPGFESTDWDAWSQEIRVTTNLDGPVNFLGGALITSSELDFRNASRVAPFPPDPVTGRDVHLGQVRRRGRRFLVSVRGSDLGYH